MRHAVIPLLLLLSVAYANAETAGILQVLSAATSERPLVQEAHEQALAAMAAVGEARSRLLPTVSLSENFYATDEPAGSLFISLNQEDLVLSPSADRYNFPPSRQDFETRLTLEQPLFDPDISYTIKRAQKGADAATFGAQRAKEGAAFSAFQAYLEVQQAQAALLWIDSSRQEASEILRLATERLAAGVGLKADVLRAQVMVTRSEHLRISADHDLLLARRSLAVAMGRAGGEVDIQAPLQASMLENLVGDRPMARADLDALSLQVDEADLGFRQSRAAYLPRLGLNASYAMHDGSIPFGTESSAWTVQAGFRWELFDGFRRSNQSDRSAATKRAATARLEESVRQAHFQLEQARLRAEEASRHLGVAESALSAAEEGQRLLLQRYEAGLDDLSAMLATQEALDRARFELVQASSRHILALGNVAYQNGTFLQNMASLQENFQ